MSLGALAAAASLAAAAVQPTPTRSSPCTLTHIPQHSHNTLHHQTSQPHQDQPAILPPQPANSAAEVVLPPISQPVPSFVPLLHSHDQQHSTNLKTVANVAASRSKTNPKPVAPAPSNVMHPSQQVQNTHPNGKPKQRRYRATPEQLRQLIARFDVNPSPSSAELQELAAKISMPTQSVVLWFKNRRARVPHKKVEKALNVKRRDNVELPVTSSESARSTKSSQNAKKSSLGPKKEEFVVNVKVSPSFTEEAAAASMAEMAMALASENAHGTPQVRQAGRNITNQGITVLNRTHSFPVRSPSRSPPSLYRAKAENVVPYDSSLVKKLGSNAGAEFVQASLFTPRRPRLIPPTPRLLSQREYSVGESVEVLETGKGICRSWYSAKILSRSGPRELSLGASAAVVNGFGGGADKYMGSERGQGKSEDDGENVGGGDSPRTVRSPAASPTPPIAKVRYTVEFEHRLEDGDEKKRLKEEVLAARIRPAAPFIVNKGENEWRPEVGEAVEVLRDGAWFVAVVQKFVIRKGYMVSFESGDAQWVRRPRLRPYQIWRGGESWVTKLKAPLPVVMKSVGLNVTHPPGGKRKRGGVEGGRERDMRGRSKKSRSTNMDGSGPDGLPEGWRIDQVRGGGMQKLIIVYVAPDGQRLKSLREAQRYVKMMGPA